MTGIAYGCYIPMDVHNFDDMRERKFVLYCYYSSQINFMKSHSLTPLSSGDQIKLRENGYLAF
jgi:hypothetical protein